MFRKLKESVEAKKTEANDSHILNLNTIDIPFAESVNELGRLEAEYPNTLFQVDVSDIDLTSIDPAEIKNFNCTYHMKDTGEYTFMYPDGSPPESVSLIHQYHERLLQTIMPKLEGKPIFEIRYRIQRNFRDAGRTAGQEFHLDNCDFTSIYMINMENCQDCGTVLGFLDPDDPSQIKAVRVPDNMSIVFADNFYIHKASNQSAILLKSDAEKVTSRVVMIGQIYLENDKSKYLKENTVKNHHMMKTFEEKKIRFPSGDTGFRIINSSLGGKIKRTKRKRTKRKRTKRKRTKRTKRKIY